NVSSLVLARASAGRRGRATRAAVGASRARLLRQFVAENLVLAVAGGLASILVSRVGLALLRALAPADVPRLDEAGLPPVVLAFTLAVSLGAGVLLGLAPALRASGRAAGSSLQEADRAGAGPARARVRTGLVIAQTALALVLLVGAGLLVRSFRNLLSVPPGFEPDRLLSVSVFLGPPAYRDLAPQRAFVRDTLAAV